MSDDQRGDDQANEPDRGKLEQLAERFEALAAEINGGKRPRQGVVQAAMGLINDVNDAWPQSGLAEFFGLTIRDEIFGAVAPRTMWLVLRRAAAYLREHEPIRAMANMPPHECEPADPEAPIIVFFPVMPIADVTVVPSLFGYRTRFTCPRCEGEQVTHEIDVRTAERFVALGAQLATEFVDQQIESLLPPEDNQT